MKKQFSFALLVLLIILISGLLAWYGISLEMLRVLVICIFFMEATSLLLFHVDMRWSPRGLFFLGWTLPFLVAQAPINLVIFNLPKITHSGFLVFFIVSGAFYIAELLVSDMRPVRRLPTLITNVISGNLDQAKFYAPRFFCISLVIASFVAYATALIHSGFSPPIFHDQVTENAKGFWAIPGSATAFSLLNIFFVLAVVRWLSKRSHGARGVDREDKLFIVFALVLSVFMFTYGKRTIFIYSYLPVAVLVLSAFRIKASNILLLFSAVIAFFVLNAYLRADNFDQYWAGRSFHSISSGFWYSLIQPVMYLNETFANLSSILDVPMSGRGDLYSELREEGKIVPLFGVLSANVGNFISLLLLFMIFIFYWFVYRLASRGLWLLVYSLLSPGLAMIWTGIIVENQGMYRLVLILLVWAFVISQMRAANQLHYVRQ